MRRAYKLRLYPNKRQEEKLFWTLNRCRELYNAALSERKGAYRMAGTSISYYEQKRDLPEIREIRPEYNGIHSQVLQDVLLRLKRAFDNFFRRVNEGQAPGYPRFQGRNRYDSFTYPQSGFALEEQKITLSKIGTLRVKVHRKVEGTIKTCTITHFAALSNGEFLESPRHYRKAEKKLKKLQEALSRKKRGSHRRDGAVKAVAMAHRRVRNQRRDFAHKATRKLVNRYQVLVLEELQTKNLVRRPKPKQDEETGHYLPNGAAAKGGLNKSISDAGWGMFTEMLQVKAASAGRVVANSTAIPTPRTIYSKSMLGQEVSHRFSRVGSLSKPLTSRHGYFTIVGSGGSYTKFLNNEWGIPFFSLCSTSPGES